MCLFLTGISLKFDRLLFSMFAYSLCSSNSAPISMQPPETHEPLDSQRPSATGHLSAAAKPLEGRCILITGASQGIGAEAAKALGQAGAQIVLLGRNELRLNQVYDEIEALGGPEPVIATLDLNQTQDEHLYQLRDQVADLCSRELCSKDSGSGLHGLIHCAVHLGTLTPLVNYNTDEWQRVMRINAEIPFRLNQVLYPLLEAASQAKVIGFTDRVEGYQAYWGAYTVSKAAHERTLQLWNEELDNISHIRCHSIYPGPRRTGLRQQAFPAENPDTVAATDTLRAAFVELFTQASTPYKLDWSSL